MKTYTFHVSLPGTGRVWRKVELRSDQTLADLHHAIQDAFEWGADHLYSFFMSGQAWDRSTEYCLPEGANPWSGSSETIAEESDTSKPAIPPALEELVRELMGDMPHAVEFAKARLGDQWEHLMKRFAEPGNVLTTRLETLKLEEGQKFLYLFDYGDEWRFRVRVHAIYPNAPEADYPRLVESVGKAPSQHQGWHDEEMS
jgi:hypothetical protein